MNKIKFHTDKIKNDLEESRINWKVVLLFIPVAFLTYIFHEFGHWIVGEILGNDMVLSLNNATSRSGHYINKTDDLYVSMGGPLFTVLQAVIFLVIIQKIKSIYWFPMIFFAAFSRFFSIVFGGLSHQDEGRISAILDISEYPIVFFVLLILSLIVWRSCYLLKLNLKAIGYYATLSTLSILLVIGVNGLLMQ
jgi:hypothetical protein